MIITSLAGNVHDEPLPEGTPVDPVRLGGAALVKRIQRVRTESGRELGLRLPHGTGDLRDGDVLHRDEAGAVVVAVEATDVLVIRAGGVAEMARVAHTLGNRHLPAQFFDADSAFGGEAMVVAYDHTVEDYLRSAGVRFDRRDCVLDTPLRHAEHTH